MGFHEMDDSKKLPVVICGFVLLFSIPFHLLLIIILIKHRKSTDLSFPFFKMLLSLSINDLITATTVGFCFSLLLLPPKIFVAYCTPWIHVLQDTFFAGGMGGDLIILVGIGINRFIVYMFPLKSIWHQFHTKLAVALQWSGYAAYALLALSGVPTDMHSTYVLNETTGMLMESVPDSAGYQIKILIQLGTLLIVGVTLAIIYSVSVGKLIYHKLTISVGQDSESLAAEARLGFQGFFLSFSLIILTFLYGYAFLSSFSVSPVFYGILFMLAVSNFVLGPFIVIGMSSIIREHIKKLFKFNNNVVPII